MSKRRVLLAVDKASEDCLAWYIENVHREGDRLILAHVHQMPPVPAGGILGGTVAITQDYTELVNASVEESKKILRKFKRCCDQAAVKAEMVLADDHSSPGHVLVKLAAERDVALIVVGTRGLGTIGRVFLGSTSNYVLHQAGKIPVFVVPRKK